MGLNPLLNKMSYFWSKAILTRVTLSLQGLCACRGTLVKKLPLGMLGLFVPTPNQNRLYTEAGYKKGLVKTIVLIHKLGKTLDGFLFLKRARRDS